MILRETVTIAPASGPVALSEFKAHERIIGADLDVQAQDALDAATSWVERHTGLAMLTQTRVRTWGCPGTVRLYLARPVDTVASMTHDGADYTDYVAHEALGFVVTGTELTGEIGVEYSCGHATAGAVPAAIRMAIRQLAGAYLENPEATAPITITTVPYTVESIVSLYREQLA